MSTSFNDLMQQGSEERRKKMFADLFGHQDQIPTPDFTPIDLDRFGPEAPPQAFATKVPAPPSRLDMLERRYNAPPSKLQAILNLAVPAAGIALGGLFGGEAGATGAAQGATESMRYNQAVDEQKHKSLLEEMEAERNRQERMQEHQLSANVDLAREKGLAEYRQGTLENRTLSTQLQDQRGRLSIEIQRQRANNYTQNIQSLTQSREAETQVGRDKLKLQAENLQRQIDRDENLDENSKAKLQQDLGIANRTLEQRGQEEAGRNARASMTQTAIGERQAKALEKGFTPMQIAMAWSKAVNDAKALGTYNDMTPEQQAELVNNMAESFMTGRVPTVSAGEGSPRLGGLLGSKTALTAKPGNPAPSRTVNPAQPGPTQQQPQKIRVRRKEDGQTGTINAQDFDTSKYERL